MAAVELPDGANLLSIAPTLPLLLKSIFLVSRLTDFLTLMVVFVTLLEF
jgi:hypothetical protein